MNFDRKGSDGHKSIMGSFCSVIYVAICLFVIVQITLANLVPEQAQQLPVVEVPEPVVRNITVFDENIEKFTSNMDKYRMKDAKVEVFAAVLDAETKDPLQYDDFMKQYIDISFVQVINKSGQKATRKAMPAVACSKVDSEASASSFICPENFEDIYLQGQNDQRNGAIFMMEVTQCQNKSICRPVTESQKYLANKKVIAGVFVEKFSKEMAKVEGKDVTPTKLVVEKLGVFDLDPYFSKTTVVELDQHSYQEQGVAKKSWLEVGKAHQDQRPRNNYYDLTIPFLQLRVALSNEAVVHGKTTHIVKDYDMSQIKLRHPTSAEMAANTNWETVILHTCFQIVSQVGGCIFVLTQLWYSVLVWPISRHNFLLKMIKHNFYLKADTRVFEKRNDESRAKVDDFYSKDEELEQYFKTPQPKPDSSRTKFEDAKKQEEPALAADLATQRSNYDTGRQLLSEHDQDGQFESLSSRSTVMDDYNRAARSPAMQAASKMNLKILKYDINRHQRIKFGRFESFFQSPIFRSCRSNDRSRTLRLGEEKVKEEINVLRMVKTCR